MRCILQALAIAYLRMAAADRTQIPRDGLVRRFLVQVTGVLFLLTSIGLSDDHGSAKFEPTWPSLEQYTVPRWFRDAKFGIFVHWGPQTLAEKAVAADGSKTRNWKDLAAAFKGEHFDAEHWADVFAKSGAKYVVQVAEHHDAYALYDSSLTPWSSVKMGPRRDIVAEVAAACRKHGLVFGCSSHTEENWWFYSDPPRKTPPAPMPGRDPGPQPDQAFLDNWYARLVEITQKYHPQIFWFDWCIEQPAYEPYLRKFAAFYYNQAAGRGEEVVLNYKYKAFPVKAGVLDISVGTSRITWPADGISPTPWQFDTMSNRKYWFWREGMDVRPAAEIIADLADVVSKNGNYLLNVPPAPDGTLTADQEKVLAEIGQWMNINGQAIYGTRPWKIFGEGPTEGIGPNFRERPQAIPYTPADFRFTTKDDTLYAVGLLWPADGKIVIKCLGSESKLLRRPLSAVALLGSWMTVKWRQTADGLTVELPKSAASNCPYVLKLRAQ